MSEPTFDRDVLDVMDRIEENFREALAEASEKTAVANGRNFIELQDVIDGFHIVAESCMDGLLPPALPPEGE